MKTIGIIAEYNPFHLGHAYQIETVRKMTGADCIVVIMSGNFVQRGAPAWTDKYLRTQMALEGGADIVLELPAVYATASAEHFALGGVNLLHELGFVDGLCFGCECEDLSILSKIADFLSAPDDDYHRELTANLRIGLSYPAAREQVLTRRFPEILRQYPALLSAPNTILGIEYLKALRKINSKITPITILRTDGGYHETKENDGFLSASGIRKIFTDAMENSFRNQEPNSSDSTVKFTDAFKDAGRYVPKHVQHILTENISRFPITEDDFSTMIYYRLRTASETELLSIADMAPELLHRIRTQLPHFTDFNEFIAHIKTKAFTYSRISRVLFHVLLGIKTQYLNSPPLYTHLLGFRKSASGLLRNVTEIPVITKAADADRQISSFWQGINTATGNQTDWSQQAHSADTDDPYRKQDTPPNHLLYNKFTLAQAHWQTDILADDLYRKIVWQKYGLQLPDTFHAPVVTLPHFYHA